jgi:large subunit ribosomal protein L30e
MIDVQREIRRAVDTGKVIIGTERTEKELFGEKIKLIILSDNCPKDIKREINYKSKLRKVQNYAVDLSSMKLGEICGKPFPIAVLSVVDQGNSKILDISR